MKTVAKGMSLDRRIGEKPLHLGLGYGDSCFPKDTRALALIGQEVGAPQYIVETGVSVNDHAGHRMIEKIFKLCYRIPIKQPRMPMQSDPDGME